MVKEKDVKGITSEKDEFSEWFTQIMLKADLADYTDVSGAIVFKPTAWAMWEKIRDECDKRFKKLGVKNVAFPLFIPESLLMKEKEHVEGFSPEVAWVTHAGNTKLNERLAVRPTSEALMYKSYSKWIRSWRDLPLKLNQWSNVVRWEFKHPVPFLRTREFHFNEGHTAYASEKGAEKEKEQILGIYKEICDEFLALPSLVGKKSDKEKFAGAVYSCSLEHYMPNGKAIQGPSFHFDGQNFAKAYGIKFLDKNGKEDFVWQNTWAISTRQLGIMFAVHSDSKGLLLPPRVAPTKVVIVPILFEDSKEKVFKVARDVKKKLGDGVELDDREEHKPGFKFNEWEMKGVPIRIEIGPKDLKSEKVVVVRRDDGKKEMVSVASLKKRIDVLLEDIQKSMFSKAEKMLKGAIVKVDSLGGVKKAVSDKKIAFAPLCKSRACEDNLKFKLNGVKVLNIPFDGGAKVGGKKCVVCEKNADYLGYVGKSY
ncbi:MAG: proline--tRNA ligase [archaeon]